MPPLPSATRKPVAICTADWHLSLKPPPFRGESQAEWLQVQTRELVYIQERAKALDVPILFAGDMFNHWDEPVELVNRVLDVWDSDDVEMLAVPGNHDLPNHCYADRGRSAYGTLARAGMFLDMIPGETYRLAIRPLRVYGFPWGVDCRVKSKPYQQNGVLNVAVVHHYCWCGNRPPHPGAKSTEHAAYWATVFGSLYDALVFGDNHEGFVSQMKPPLGPNVVNCGCLTRRRADERNYHVGFWYLREDGTFDRDVFATGHDKYRDEETAGKLTAPEAAGFVAELRKLADKGLDFYKAVERFCKENNFDQPTVSEIRDILEKSRDQKRNAGRPE